MRYRFILWLGLALAGLPVSVWAAEGLNSTAGSDLPLGASNTEYMRITTSGNVGIGTSTPTVLLDVAQNKAIKVGNAFLSSGGRLCPFGEQ